MHYLQGNQDYKLTENKVNRDINFLKKKKKKKLNGCNVIPYDVQIRRPD